MMSSQVVVNISDGIQESVDVLIRNLILQQDMTNQVQLSIFKQWEEFNAQLDRMHKVDYVFGSLLKPSDEHYI
jgi:hypothetical protein